jgi:hypothetical protein
MAECVVLKLVATCCSGGYCSLFLRAGPPSSYRACKPLANKCPLKQNTKQAPARTNKRTSVDKQSTTFPISVPYLHIYSPSSFFHPIFIPLFLCLPGCGSEAADSSSQTPQAGKRVQGELQCSVCRHLISSGPVAVYRPPACRSSGPMLRHPSKRSVQYSFLIRPA